MSHLEFLRALINEQANARRERSLAHRIHVAGFAQSKTLADFDWQFNAEAIDRVRIETLAGAEFIGRRQNLVWVGQSGVGKSHLIQAIGQAAPVVLGYRVRYRTEASILQQGVNGCLGKTTTPPRFLGYYAKFDLVILDEFGFDRVERLESPQAASLMYKLINVRDELVDGRAGDEMLRFREMGVSIWVIRRWPWRSWTGSSTGAAILKINGKSYQSPHRAGTSLGRQTVQEVTNSVSPNAARQSPRPWPCTDFIIAPQTSLLQNVPP